MTKMANKEKAKGVLVKGKAAAKPKNMEYNKKLMESKGYSKKRAEGTAYGEVGMEKKARRDESKGMKKAVVKHLKKDNKEMKEETKAHKKLIKKVKEKK